MLYSGHLGVLRRHDLADGGHDAVLGHLLHDLGDDINLDGLIIRVTGITKRGRGKDLTKETPEEQTASFEAQMKMFRMMKQGQVDHVEKTGEWPPGFLESKGEDNPLLNNAAVEAIQSQNLAEMVEHNINGTTPTPWAPHVIDAHQTYADEARWERECEHFLSSAVFAGISKDLPEPNSYRRFEVLGKSVLMTRDRQGTFRAFENRCMHRGAELVNAGPDSSGKKLIHVCDFHAWSYGSDGKLMGVPEEYGFDSPDDGSGSAADRGGLTELPSAERAGMLFLVPTPCDDETAAAHFDAVMPPDLEAELSAYNIGEHHRAVEQTFTIDSNWKLPIDTFGETYHFDALHPQLREALVGNCSTFKSFGGLGSNASRFTLAQNEVSLMKHLPKEEWSKPSSISHMIPAYHLGPNIVFLINGGKLNFNQFWPGEHVGECVAHIWQVTPDEVPDPQSFMLLLNVVAIEDFPQLPKMQANFAAAKHAEVIFGRNEPVLTDRHTFYDKKFN